MSTIATRINAGALTQAIATQYSRRAKMACLHDPVAPQTNTGTKATRPKQAREV